MGSAPSGARGPRGRDTLSRIVHSEGTCTTRDGLALYWQGWLPESPRGLLLVVHGLFEHGGRHLNVAHYFTRRGYGCYAVDLRGHGRSPGRRVHVGRFDEFLWDLEAAQRLVRHGHPDLPMFLVGHSHGGLIVALYALRHPEGLPGIVLSSPFMGFHASSKPSAALGLLAQALSRIWPSVLLPVALDATAISHDKLVVEAYSNDPLVSRTASPRWLLEALAAMEEVHSEAPRLAVPALVMAAGDDRIVDAQATARFVQAAPPERIEYVRWNGLYHEIFNEFEKEDVFRRMESWLTAR